MVKRFKRKYFSSCFIIPLLRSSLVPSTIYRISQVEKVFPGDSKLWIRRTTFLMAVQTNSVGMLLQVFSISYVWNGFDLQVATPISCSTSLMHGSVNVLKSERRGNTSFCVFPVCSPTWKGLLQCQGCLTLVSTMDNVQSPWRCAKLISGENGEHSGLKSGYKCRDSLDCGK